MVAAAPGWEVVWPEVRKFLSNCKVLLYNAGFDGRMVYQACRRHKLPAGRLDSECVMETYARYAKSYNDYHQDFTWISLQEAVHREGIYEYLPHRAAGDCVLTVRLLRKIAEPNKQ
ncbi:3'-5' exonuclease [Paenibacillus alkaliterrae]|uniref:3'-5' exonuclease n=1 Tax=Paenibacillus alkaliterrae TaxID=320909 RepID=UPI0022860D8A|nr:3'-5' exonuclease [Paenibacillus alkaliterrae]